MPNRPFSPLTGTFWISPESAKYTSGISIPDAMARDGLDLADIFDQIKIGPLSRGMGFGTWASLSVLGVSFGTLRRLPEHKVRVRGRHRGFTHRRPAARTSSS